MSEILSVRHLTYSYGDASPFMRDAITDLNFSVNQGEIVGIVGRTGSGKSTLVQHLNGLLKPTAGQIFYNGCDIWEKPKEIGKIRAQIGLVFQYPEYQLFEETVFADIAFGPKNAGLSGEELTRRVSEICQLIGIPEDYLQKSPFDLSGGEKRRIAIAGVMAMRPNILIFDEPIAGLDPRGRSDILRMIREYRQAYRATVLVISHNMEDMAELADRLLVLNNGRQLAWDTVSAVFSDRALMQTAGLRVPMITEVFDTLRKKGYRVPTDIFTVDAAVRFLSTVPEKGGKHA